MEQVQSPNPTIILTPCPYDPITWSRYNRLFVIYLVGATAGPIIAIALFKKYGDTWTLPELRRVFLAGMALEIVAIPLAFWLRDVKDPTLARPSQLLTSLAPLALT